jgi:hypothetical protein
VEEPRFTRRYLVRETEYAQPAGVPYIRAEVADAIYAELYLDRQPVKTTEEMNADPRLLEALE